MRLYPLTGQPLGLGDLFASHPLRDSLLVRLRHFIPLGSGEGKPHIGEDPVPGHPLTRRVHNPEVELSVSAALLSC